MAQSLDRVFLKLKKLIGIIEKDILREISDLDIGNLTMAEIGIMDAIGRHSEKTIKEIADQLEVAVSTPTKTMDRLVKKGYITRKTSDHDRRMVVSTLTEKGNTALEKIAMMRQKKINAITAKLTSEELNQLQAMIDKLM